MSHTLTRRHIIISVALHIIIALALGLIMQRDSVNNKNVIIFGAHTRHPTHALYRSNNLVPFTGTTPHKGPSGKKTRKSGRKAKRASKNLKKAAAQKKSNARTKKLPTLKKPTMLAEVMMPTSMVSDDVVKMRKKILKKKLKKQKMVAPMPEPEELVPEEPLQQQVAPEETPQPQEQVVEPELTPVQEDLLTDESYKNEATDSEENESISVGIFDSSNPVMRAYQKAIAQEFNRLWHPPVGVPKGTECVATFHFNDKGQVETIEFTKNSGIPIYELSILRLKLGVFNLPLKTRGEKITITFRE